MAISADLGKTLEAVVEDLRYPLVVGPADSNVRRAVHGSYGIFYTVANDGVRIVRILHHARDYERLLFPDD